MFSALSHLECSKCSSRYDADIEQHLCACGAPLYARYDLETAKSTLTRDALVQRPPDLWRLHELLPVRAANNVVSLGERPTPNVRLGRLGDELGIDALIVKDESLLPTGSFKARGAAIGISRAKELGARDVALPTNGNAGGAWSAYAARAGLRAHVAIPRAAPGIHARECQSVGAEVETVDGTIDDAAGVVSRWLSERGYYDASTLKEPYRIEGKKTIGFEIAESFGWQLPDVIIYPTGGGVGLIGMHKAFEELQQLGFIGGNMPRFVAVQSSGCAPIVRAWEEKKPESTFWEGANTTAYGINVPKALGDFLILRLLNSTDGTAVAVPDTDIESMQSTVASVEGLVICPEGAATVAAAKTLRANGWIHADDRVLVINTGSGLKYL